MIFFAFYNSTGLFARPELGCTSSHSYCNTNRIELPSTRHAESDPRVNRNHDLGLIKERGI